MSHTCWECAMLYRDKDKAKCVRGILSAHVDLNNKDERKIVYTENDCKEFIRNIAD